ncbi:COQ7 protein, partial [Polyodon spathula]|nr:COQ7 protein [Polyodon spathula]
VPPAQDSPEKDMLDRVLRVDHAGEFGANRFYAGQKAILGRTETGLIIQVHTGVPSVTSKKTPKLLYRFFKNAKWLAMPVETFLSVWTGACSALLGKVGPMACTVAVEESISEHYNSQIRTLMEEDPDKYKELLEVFYFRL